MFANVFDALLNEGPHEGRTAFEEQRVYDDVIERWPHLSPNEWVRETETLLNIRNLVVNNNGQVAAYRS